MKVLKPRGLFRQRRLVHALTATLLPLAAAAAVAPCAARPQAQNRKTAVQVASGDMNQCGPSRKRKSDADISCLRGKVRAVTAEHFTARTQDGLVVEGDLYAIVKDYFDESGNRTMAEISDNAPGPVGVVYRRGFFSFDAQGRAAGSKWYEDGSDAPKSVVAYSYDERGNRVKIDSARTEPDAHIVQEFTYDEEGREVGGSFSRLTADGWQTQTHKTAVTVEGGTTHSRSYSPDGKLRGRVTVLKDERGNPLSEELYGVDARGEERLLRKVAYRYDPRGFLTEVVYHKAEEWLGARAVYEYDEKGNVTSLTRYNGDGTFAAGGRREYVYDAAGNWVKRVTYSRRSEGGAAEAYHVERRQITYY